MKIAVLGPIAKDFTTVDGKLSIHIGGIPYYVAVALKNLGVNYVVAYVTASKEDKKWLTKNFEGVKVKHLPAGKTLESHMEYSTSNPDERKQVIKCYPNTIELTISLIKELNAFDYIILGPLFHDNIPLELFSKLKDKNLIHGNFGMFTYGEKGKFIKKHPENLVKVLPFLKYLFLDKNEAEFVSGKKGIKASAKFFQEHGLINMIITEGSKGSHLFIGKKYYKIPAFPSKRLIDPTGAGDTYLAAFVRATELFNDPKEQGKFAAMVATMSLEKKGAFNSKKEEVIKRLTKE